MEFFRFLTLLALLVPVLRLAGAPAPVPSTQSVSPTAFTFADLGEKDILVKSIYDQVQVHFPLAEGRQIERSVLRLHLSHGKTLLPERSDLTIALNDEPAANLVLTSENASEAFIGIELPTRALRPGDNTLTFRFNLRLDASGCADVGKSDLWAKIFSDTAVEYNGHDVPLNPDLGRFPAPFITLSNLPGDPQISLVLPPRPTPEELTAAAQIAAVLGQAARWEAPPLWVFTADQLSQDHTAADHLILIGTAGRNPLAPAAVPGLTEQLSPYNPNRLLLIVSGSDAASLLQAAALLATGSAHSALQGTHVASLPVNPQPIQPLATLTTFAGLGFEIRRVRGIGGHDLYFPIDVPYDWKTTSDASIELRFTHAHGMASSSRMNAFVNGFQVADVQLNNRNDTNGRLVIQLSPRQIHPGRNWLHLLFELHLRGEDCNFRYLEEAWAEISASDSLINLAHVNSEPPLELRYLPSPMITPPDLSANTFVLPELPTSAELTALARISAKLGAYSRADGLRPQATTTDRFSTANLAPGTHVIALGSPESNSLLAQFDAQLPQPLHRLNGTIEPAGGRELLPEEKTSQTGYLQLLPAPWSRQETLVVVSAPAEEQLFRVVEVIPTMGHRLKIQGNVAIITPEKTYGLSLGGLTGASLPGPTRVILSAVLMGAFVAIGGVGVIANRYSKAREKETKIEEE